VATSASFCRTRLRRFWVVLFIVNQAQCFYSSSPGMLPLQGRLPWLLLPPWFTRKHHLGLYQHFFGYPGLYPGCVNQSFYWYLLATTCPELHLSILSVYTGRLPKCRCPSQPSGELSPGKFEPTSFAIHRHQYVAALMPLALFFARLPFRTYGAFPQCYCDLFLR
jgi:hypothetical protein